MATFENLADELDQLTLQIRHDMEQAEDKVPRVNGLISELTRVGLLTPGVVLGPRWNSDRSSGETDLGATNEVVIAALVIPDGFGVLRIDGEEERSATSSPNGIEAIVPRYFIPFDDCRPVEKASLLAFLGEILEDLIDTARIADAKADGVPPRIASEVFSESRAGDEASR